MNLRKLILVTGAFGQLGSEFVEVLKTKKSELGTLDEAYENFDVVGFGHSDLDISNQIAVFETIEKIKPSVVINCAAYTDVDGCESNRDLAFKINALGPRNLAIACEKIGSKLVQISTDYVFYGDGNEPKIECNFLNPQSIYGSSKALGERYVAWFCKKWFIVRTSWLYGKNGKNFVKTIAKLAKEKGYLKVVDDQIGNPTNVCDVVFNVLKLVLTNFYGIYHCTGNGECSWFDFACEIKY